MNIAIAILIVVGTAAALEHRLDGARPGQFGVGTLLLLPVMAAGVHFDPTLAEIPTGIYLCPLWAFLWFGVGCTVYAASLLLLRLARRLRRPATTQPTDSR